MIKAASRPNQPHGIAGQKTAKKGPALTLKLAREVLRIEAGAISSLISRLDHHFIDAVSLILNCRGRVVVCGVGKSGQIARKIASTMASTGTPAFFVHAAEASHGDLGMITRDDVLLAMSNSGESTELLTIIPMVKRQGAKLISITGDSQSTLAQQSDVHLDAHVEQEACPLNLAPTASTTAALALGDALAVALLDARGFSAEDFARSHPAGQLGRRLLTRVSDVMRTGDGIPSVRHDASFSTALLEMSNKHMGMTAVLDAQGRVAGVFTDGDLRRCLDRSVDIQSAKITDLMTRKPRTITSTQLAVEAVELMERFKVNQVLVVDDSGKLTGALNMHDLFHAKVV